MTITQTTALAAAIAAHAADLDALDSIDADFTAWEWTQAMTEPVSEDVKWEDCLDVEWAEALGVI